jgi:hypothetical protein
MPNIFEADGQGAHWLAARMAVDATKTFKSHMLINDEEMGRFVSNWLGQKDEL